MFNKSLFAVGAIATFSVAVTPAYAGRVLRVSAEAALEGSVPLVVHSEGGGIILDFSPTGETIQKISLDDPSKIVYDHCLLTKSCGARPSPTVRVFRSKGIAFADLPSVKATLLSVETLDASNEWHSYIFPVTTSNAPATYNKVLIGGSPPRNRSRFGGSLLETTDSSSKPDASYAVTALGMRQAQQKQLLVDPQLKGRVRTYLQLIQSGMSDKLAARKAGVSPALVQHLQDLGQQRVDEMAAQQKATASAQVAAQQKASAGPVAEALKVSEQPKAEDQPKPKRKRKHNPHSADKPQTPLEPQVSPKPAVTVTPSSPPDSVQTVALNSGRADKPVQSEVPPPVAPLVQLPGAAPVQSTASIQWVTPAAVKPKANAISRQTYANALVRGLNKARLDGKIRYGSNKWYAVNGAIRLLRSGASLDKAIAASGMQRDGFMKLLRDGGIES
jgi:hypothetical protein